MATLVLARTGGVSVKSQFYFALYLHIADMEGKCEQTTPSWLYFILNKANLPLVFLCHKRSWMSCSLLLEGFQVCDISRMLERSITTISSHKMRAFHKLNIKSDAMLYLVIMRYPSELD